jgi:lanosterol synthase
MLAAQYVMFAHAVGLELSAERRAALLRHFEHTRLPDGCWGLHELSAPYLFTTTLVYVAARLLGVASDSELLARALAFIRREDVVAIPSWGKLWLALLGLYDWRGVPPVVPELFALPRWLPIHPSRFYCHTRQIYLAMSGLHARRATAPDCGRLRKIREELYPTGMAAVDWRKARSRLRAAELVTPPGLALRLVYRALGLYDRHALPQLRARTLAELGDRLRFELRSTDFTALSPVSGLLSILALHTESPGDEDAARAIARLDAWMWSGPIEGLRIAGARSATWDTSFALQALALAPSSSSRTTALQRGVAFLRTQQIRQTVDGHRSAYRLDPNGGFCFAGVWHGWPVSDCTAEALDALAHSGCEAFGRADEIAAVHFILRCQNPDGGFGSYEARRTRVGLEWLNPAEMFGESMTEHSYVECTGSCLAALADFRTRHPDALTDVLDRAIARAERRLRRLQRRDGSWRGVWGVQFVYGTLFGVRGLRAAGAKPDDPALRRAATWLRATQRADGGWGEHHSGCLRGHYVEHPTSQVLQTAWALMALLEAGDPDWAAISRGARFLLDAQQPDGSWPRQDPAGLFFQTALLEYALYRLYFPLWALALYEQRHPENRPGVDT